MKTKAKKALHDQTLVQLKSELKAAQTDLIKARLAKAAKKTKDTQAARRIQRKITIIKTIIREKEL